MAPLPTPLNDTLLAWIASTGFSVALLHTGHRLALKGLKPAHLRVRDRYEHPIPIVTSET
jgi:hypothetical protein